MTAERFRQIAELYHAAREGTAGERAALLAQADPELRREVESLLAQPDSGDLPDRPGIENIPELLEESTVAGVTSGACLGPYRLESKLGVGGMGEVLRAVDTRLGRAVAIKTTQDRFSARFEREARAIASLNHPNICTLYDVGPNYLVMELVEGETLAARLKSGPIPPNTALLYAGQLAAALVEAHAKGIVHRDLKPGNIMIGKAGVKVLDFGLASLQGDPTITSDRMVIGTPAYMAPPESHPCAQTGNNRRPVSQRRSREPLAVRCRVTAGIGRGSRGAPRTKDRLGLFATPGAETDAEGQDSAGRIGEQDRRSGVRWNPSRGLVRATGTVPLPDARLESTGPPGAAADEPAARDAPHPRGSAGDL